MKPVKTKALRATIGAFTIRKRVAALVVGSLLGVAVVIGTFTWVDQRTRAALVQVDADTLVLVDLKQGMAALQTLRDIGLVETAREGQDVVPRIESQVALVNAGYKAEAEPATLEAHRETVDRLEALIREIADAETRIGLDETQGERGALAASSEAIGAQFRAIAGTIPASDPRLLVVLTFQGELLLGQRDEKDFMLYGDADVYRANSRTRIAGLTPLLDQLTGVDGVAGIREQIAAHGERFAGYVDLVSRRDALHAALDDTYQALVDPLDTLTADVNWRVAEAQFDMRETADRGTILIWSASAVIACLVALAGYVIGLGISRPLGRLRDAMEHLASNEVETDVPGQTRRDEIGEMARAVQVFKDNAIEMRRLSADEDERKAARSAERRREMNDLADAFEATAGKALRAVDEAARTIEASSGTLATVSAETSENSALVSSSADQATKNVTAAAAAAEQMSATVSEIAEQMSRTASDMAETTAEIERTDEDVTRLSEACSRIGAIVTLIDEIAGQTNLLSLNATIEAARAGESGKGFAVVAAEVKTLAQGTTSATRDIGEQIEALQATAEKAASAMARMRTRIDDANRSSTAIAAAVEEQSATVRDVARNSTEAASGTRAVSDAIGGVLTGARTTREASDAARANVEDLGRAADALKRDVGQFLDRVRAA